MDIFLDYAKRMGFRDKDGQPLIKWEHPEEAFEAWKECTRGRLCDYTGMSYEKLRGGSGVQWPCNEEHPDGTERLYEDGYFKGTETDFCENYGKDLLTGAAYTREEHAAMGIGGRAWIRPAGYNPPHEQPGGEYPLSFTTGRTVYHFHTRTKTKRAPQLDAAPDVWVEISPSDAESLGVVEGDVVRVESPRGSMEAKARISGIKEGVVFAPFHYGYFDEAGGDEPDGRARAANELTITEWDPVSKQPLFKVGAVRVTKVRDGGGEPSPAPTTTAAASEPARAGAPVSAATAGGGAAEATETVGEG